MSVTQSAWTTRPARLVLADDHDLVRAGLRGMLTDERDLEVVGEAATGREAIALCRRLRPDLALIDVRMPDLDGLATTRTIREECPQTRVIMVTFYLSSDYLLEAITAGASGYLLKETSRPEMLDAIRRVLRGETILNGEAATELVCRLASARPQRQSVPAVDRLTPREHDVLHLLAAGHTNRAIAVRLGVSAGTVKIHVEHIIGKLQAADRTQAAMRAVQLGLLDAEAV